VVDGVRQSTKMCYLGPALGRPNLRVVSGALTHRLLWRSDQTCDGVELEVDGGLARLQADRVVLCAGAVNTPLILMRSGIGSPAQLEPLGIEVRRPLPGVGDGLMDHPVVGIWGIPRADACKLGEPARQVLLRYTSTGSRYRNDMHICTMAGIDVAELFPQLAQSQAAPTIAGLLASYNRSVSRGAVRIASADPAAAPLVSINCLSDPRDVAPLKEGVRLSWKLLQHPSLHSKFDRFLAWTDGMIRSDVALEQAVRAFVRPAAHLGCSARMGRSPDGGAVVDARGKVHGVDNLFVGDLSIAPSLPSAPTHLTALMIAEKIAAGLRRAP
jgi:choline dehydrogenase